MLYQVDFCYPYTRTLKQNYNPVSVISYFEITIYYTMTRVRMFYNLNRCTWGRRNIIGILSRNEYYESYSHLNWLTLTDLNLTLWSNFKLFWKCQYLIYRSVQYLVWIEISPFKQWPNYLKHITKTLHFWMIFLNLFKVQVYGDTSGLECFTDGQ